MVRIVTLYGYAKKPWIATLLCLLYNLLLLKTYVNEPTVIRKKTCEKS
jgi:hypothetical protein